MKSSLGCFFHPSTKSVKDKALLHGNTAQAAFGRISETNIVFVVIFQIVAGGFNLATPRKSAA
ncbi:hypothetical protein [Jannaschia sp. CCS1]|uniref:hypothetical protein n=1 Tax=Jannaschia sp. (strain CCS1) TaxID=290400 RepID=UPI0002E85053|nr:hypothetical protein [Jannaschia sp. CCS1]